MLYDIRALYANLDYFSPHSREILEVARKWPHYVGTFAKELRADIERNGTMAVPGIVRFYAKWGGKHGRY
jgi:hypothetical protein